MTTLFILLALFLVASANVWDRPEGLSHQDAFEQYNTFWGKTYNDQAEKAHRLAQFMMNAGKIQAQNAARRHPHEASFGYTRFSDLSEDEFKKILGYQPLSENKKREEEAFLAKPPSKPTPAPPTAAPTSAPTARPTAAPTAAPTAVPTSVPTSAPTSAPTARPTSAPTAAPTSAPTSAPATTGLAPIDWVARGKTTPVKDQGQCGSCWAHAAVQTVESVNLIAGNAVVPGSIQQLVNCDNYAYACNGGDPRQALSWIITNGGLTTASCWPYTATKGICSTSCPLNPSLKITSVVTVTRTEPAMYTALTKTPLSIACYASQWQNYRSGVLEPAQCGYQTPDHAIQITGYGTDSLGGYWIVRNSWGVYWGESGFLRIRYGKNTCNITLQVLSATATSTATTTAGGRITEDDQDSNPSHAGVIIGSTIGAIMAIAIVVVGVIIVVVFMPRQERV